jgi:hypothetical protein
MGGRNAHHHGCALRPNDQSLQRASAVRLESDDVSQADCHGIEGLSAANLNVIRVSIITTHAKKKRELKYDLSKFFNYVLLKASVASQLLIEPDGEWAAAKSAEDPNAFVVIVHRAHITHIGGATPDEAKINMQKSLHALEQGSS